MIKLMRLELKKNKINTYVISSIVITVVMLGFLYLLAYIPQLDPSDEDIKMFIGYRNIISVFSIFNMTVFCVLSAVMYSKFIIEEYDGKRAILLFSYPISRGKVFKSKIVVVSLFAIIAMIFSNFIIFIIFNLTEIIHPLLAEKMTMVFAVQLIKTTFIMAILGSGLAIVSTGIGFIKKSVPTTIISAVVLCSLLSNLVAETLTPEIPITIFTVITLIAGIIIVRILTIKVNHMEVE